MTMENKRQNRKLRRREFLQTVAAGGAVMPALGLGAAPPTSPSTAFQVFADD
jgi:hypothetical protein